MCWAIYTKMAQIIQMRIELDFIPPCPSLSWHLFAINLHDPQFYFRRKVRMRETESQILWLLRLFPWTSFKVVWVVEYIVVFHKISYSQLSYNSEVTLTDFKKQSSPSMHISILPFYWFLRLVPLSIPCLLHVFSKKFPHSTFTLTY